MKPSNPCRIPTDVNRSLSTGLVEYELFPYLSDIFSELQNCLYLQVFTKILPIKNNDWMKDYIIVFPEVGKYYFMYNITVKNKMRYLLIVDVVWLQCFALEDRYTCSC